MEPTQPPPFFLGASHHTPPLAVPGKIALHDARAAALAARLQETPGVGEFALLSTCNRVEVYGVSSSAAVLTTLRTTFAETTGCAPADLEGVLELRQNHDVVSHLFSVASGLDS